MALRLIFGAVPGAAPGGAPKAKAGPKAKARAKAKAKPKARPKGGRRREAEARHWIGVVNNPDVNDLRNWWCFNEPGGPVPVAHQLGYIIIAHEHANQPGKTPHLQMYFEFMMTRVTLSKLKGWFGDKPHLEPRCCAVSYTMMCKHVSYMLQAGYSRTGARLL